MEEKLEKLIETEELISTKEKLLAGTKGFLYANTLFYQIPSVISGAFRESKNTSAEDESFQRVKKYFVAGMFTGGIIGNFAQHGAYLSLTESNPEILFIPLTTNSISLIYETGKTVFNNYLKRGAEK